MNPKHDLINVKQDVPIVTLEIDVPIVTINVIANT